MKNYVQPGNTITLTAPYAVTSGEGLLVGSIFGVAAGTAASGEPAETALVGVFDLTKVGSQAWTVGANVYWDDTNKRTTAVLGSSCRTAMAKAPNAGRSDDPLDAPFAIPLGRQLGHRRGAARRGGRSLRGRDFRRPSRQANLGRRRHQRGLHRRRADRHWGAPLGPGDSLDIRIFQLSALIGRGAPKTVTLTF